MPVGQTGTFFYTAERAASMQMPLQQQHVFGDETAARAPELATAPPPASTDVMRLSRRQPSRCAHTPSRSQPASQPASKQAAPTALCQRTIRISRR